VIAAQGPDIVALQEIDAGLTRSGFVDQACMIADELHMFLHFHPCLQVERGQYGNAILSRFPMELVKADGLPVVPSLCRDEVRGALWVKIQLDYCSVQMITTHLGLTVRERICQAEILLGPQWLAHRDCMSPVIFCGDLNTLPASRIYRSFGTVLADTQRAANKRQLSPTWPSIFPFLRLDYIFVSPLVNVQSASVIRNPLTAIASDHLPVVAEVDLP